MKLSLHIVLTVVVLLCPGAEPAPAQPPAAKRAMALDDIFRIKQISDPQISPDGTRAVFVVSSADFERGRWDTDLWLVKIGEEPRQITFNIGRDNSPRWSPDGRTVAFLRARPEAGQAAAQIYLLPMNPGGEAYAATNEALGVGSFEWAPGSNAIFYMAAQRPAPAAPAAQSPARDRANVEDEARPHASIWYLNLATGERSRIATGSGHVREFAVAPDGKALVFSAAPTPYFNEGPQSELFYLALSAAEPGEPRQLTRNSLITEGRMAWRPDGSGVAFLADADARLSNRALQSSLFYWDRASGEIRNLQVTTATNRQEDYVASIEEVEWLGQDVVIFSAGNATNQQIYTFNLQAVRTSALTAEREVSGDFSVSRQGVVAYVNQSPERPGDVWLMEPGKQGLITGGNVRELVDLLGKRALTKHSAPVEAFALPTFSVIRWRASDGQMVEGIYLEPHEGANGKRPFPLITMIHGGPAAAEIASFRPFASVLAGAGFAVFLPNYRGSTNYGEEFAARSVGDRNGRDAQDILEGIDELIRRGWVDKERLGVMGWSAGGVLTNWITANTTRFRAASSGAGVSDWRMQYFLSDYTYGSRYYMLGSPWDKNDFYWERSPLRLAAQVKTPTLIHCGERDERVPIAHSRAWFRALREHGVEARFVVYPGEPHSLQNPHHQRRRHSEDLQWFTRHLLGRP